MNAIPREHLDPYHASDHVGGNPCLASMTNLAINFHDITGKELIVLNFANHRKKKIKTQRLNLETRNKIQVSRNKSKSGE